jgi:hypothetical protein
MFPMGGLNHSYTGRNRHYFFKRHYDSLSLQESITGVETYQDQSTDGHFVVEKHAKTANRQKAYIHTVSQFFLTLLHIFA